MASTGTNVLEVAGWRGCDGCGEAIASPVDAVLTVSPELLAERREAMAERERALAAGEDAPRTSTGLIPWDWVHRSCLMPRPEEYVIPGERLDTMPKMLARTLELMERPWFMETAWEDAVRRFYSIPLD